MLVVFLLPSSLYHTTTPLAAAVWTTRSAPARHRAAVAQSELPPDFELPPGFREHAGFAEILPTSGARAKRDEVDEYAKKLGARHGYAAVDDFVKEHVPASGQPGQRRRKKEWDPSKRKPHRKERGTGAGSKGRGVRRAKAPKDTRSHEELLRVARPALTTAAASMGIELVGVVLMRPPRGPTPSAFRCWVASAPSAEGDCEVGLPADELARASTALRDALWREIPGKPAISVIAVGSDETSRRPLFTPADFERFRGRRVQLTFRELVDGRRRLVGELVRVETHPLPDGVPDGTPDGTVVADTDGAGLACAIVADETAGAPLRAPLGKLLLGEKTSLLPRADAAAGALAPLSKRGSSSASEGRRRGGGGGGGVDSAAAAAFVDAALCSAAVVIFLRSYAHESTAPLLRVLREAGCEEDDERLRLVPVDGREETHAIRQHLEARTGHRGLPYVCMGSGTGVFGEWECGWSGSAEDLVGLASAGPGRVAARLQEAAWTHAHRSGRDVNEGGR